MYPDDELKAIARGGFHRIYPHRNVAHIAWGLDILKDQLFCLIFLRIRGSEKLQKSSRKQQQIRSAVCSGAGGESVEKVERKAIVNQRRRYGGRMSLKLLHAIRMGRDRRRPRVRAESTQEEQLAANALGLDHRIGLRLLSLLDSCNSVKSRVESLSERLSQSQTNSSAERRGAALRSDRKLIRMILSPAVEMLIMNCVALLGSGAARALAAEDLTSWLQIATNIVVRFLAPEGKHDKESTMASSEMLQEAEHDQLHNECLELCRQLSHDISCHVEPRLKSHVDGFKQWLSVERWRLHNDRSYRFNPWYNVARQDVFASLDYHRSASRSMDSLETVDL